MVTVPFAVSLAQSLFEWSVPALTTVAIFIQDHYYSTLILWLFLAYVTLDRRRFIVSLLTLGLTVGFVSGLKQAFNEPRPCNSETVAGKTCDTESGFPSGHASTSFALALGSLGTRVHYLFLLASVVITLSRIYMGAHSFAQVAGGWAVAGVAFAMAEQLHDWMHDYASEHHPHLVKHLGQHRRHLPQNN